MNPAEKNQHLCSRCQRWLDVDAFRPNPRMRSGVNSWCKACQVERTRQWRAENPDHAEAYNAERREIRVPAPPRRITCPDCRVVFEVRGYRRFCDTCRRNRETARCVNRDRFYRKGDLDAGTVSRLKAATKRCPLCRCSLSDVRGHPRHKHLDHIIPRDAGGQHVLTNVRVICAACNIRRPVDLSDLDQLPIGVAC